MIITNVEVEGLGGKAPSFGRQKTVYEDAMNQKV
jgi:hypothetical protein